MPFHDEADPFADDPPPPLTCDDWLTVSAFGIGLIVFAVLLLLGLRCAWHRIEHSVALLAW